LAGFDRGWGVRRLGVRSRVRCGRGGFEPGGVLRLGTHWSEYYGAGDRADLLGSMTRESGRPWVIYVVATGVVVRLAAYQQVEASVPSAGGRGAHS